MKKVLALGDMHCGHVVGLTPPDWRCRRRKTGDAQAALYDAFLEICKGAGAVDVCIVNGDCIDGKGEASGGTELITADREEQCEMAIVALANVKAKKFVFTRGTPYHVGKEEDWENIIAERMDAKINDVAFLSIDGVAFNVRHHAGSSAVPHGRHTGIAREALWDAIWAMRGEQDRANILLRSHVHYHAFSGDADFLAMTLPALQGKGSKFGARKCVGTVDFGAVIFECNKGVYSWRSMTRRIKQQNHKMAIL